VVHDCNDYFIIVGYLKFEILLDKNYRKSLQKKLVGN